MRAGAAVALVLVPFLLRSTAAAQLPADLSVGEEAIEVEAESLTYDQQSNSIVAEGKVLIRRGASELRADAVRLNRGTNQAVATGHVSLSDPEGIAFAERMEVNLDDETGTLDHAEIHTSKRRYSLWGDRIEKGVGQAYRIENGRFTTCDCESGPPSWSLLTDQLDVSLDSYGVAEGARFRILDVPVLYLPWVAFPVNQERESGLLFPRFGASNRRGFQIVQPFYWAINKSQDATLGLDVETSARIGLLGEYRYALSRTLQGEIKASYFNEAIRGAATGSEKGTVNNPEVPENRWGVLSKHTQTIGPVEAYADLLLVGDDLFLREINTLSFDHGTDVALRTRPFTESRAGALQRWSRLSLQAETVYYQDLVNEQSLVLQQLPEVRLTGQKALGDHVLTQLAARATDFQREQGIDGLRADLQPGAQIRVPLGRSVFGSLRATFHETAYDLTESKMKDGFRGDDPNGPEIDLPGSRTREIAELGGELSTGVSRTFGFDHFGLTKLKHTIEPRAEYLFVPNIAQDDIMVFDGIDRIERRNLFTYGVVSRLLARAGDDDEQKKDVYELTRVAVSQSYDVQREIPDATTGGPPDHLSDIDFDLRVNPSRRTQIRFVSSLDTKNAALSTVTVGARLLSPYGPEAGKGRGARQLLNRTRLGVAYRFVTDDSLKNSMRSLGLDDSGVPAQGVEQVDGNLELRLTEHIGLLYAARYNIRANEFLENHFGLRLLSSCNCWGLEVGVTDKSNPNELEVRMQVTLVGLGSARL